MGDVPDVPQAERDEGAGHEERRGGQYVGDLMFLYPIGSDALN